MSQFPWPAERAVNFDTDIKPIFDQHCLRCHGPARPKGGVRLDEYAAFLQGGHNGPIVIPGKGTNSTLIQVVARLDPDSAMPPEGEGDPLTPAQVGLLRAWVDQGVWWSREEDKSRFSLTVAPALGYTAVSGNEAKFRQHAWQPDGWRGGVESFELFEQVSPATKYTLRGHALTDDYLADLLVERQDLGFARFGFEQFRKYDVATGGYHPGFNPSLYSLNRDLYLDVGRAWADVGLTLPDWPRFVLGYEYQYRNGDKATLQWGSVTDGVETRKIYPAYKEIDEKTHVVKFAVDFERGGWRIGDDFRGEWTDTSTRQVNVPFYDPAFVVQENVNQGWSSFQGANTLRVERQFKPWLSSSAGYLYSRLDGDADFSLFSIDPSGTATLIDSAESIMLERDSHVGNVNALLGPWEGGVLVLGLQGELTEQTGTLEDATQNFFGLPTITNGLTEIRRTVLDESVLLRVTRVPLTTLFAEARLQQECIEHNEDLESDFTSFARDTDSESDSFETRIGFDTSPLGWLKFGSQYRWRDRSTTFDDGYADGDPGEFLVGGYPTLISALDQTTHELETRITLRPNGWFKTTFTHRWSMTDYETTTEPAAGDIPGDESPGGRIFAGNYDAQIFSLNFSLTPWKRFTSFATLSYQDVQNTTIQDSTAAVVPYRGDVWSVLLHGRYVLTKKTDVTAGYTYSTADFQQNDFATGLPLGMHYRLHGLQVGLVSRCTENLSTKLQYGFYHYAEPSSGGANDYTANAVFVSLNWRLN